eukprot:TRINITY_DN1625_c0_g3_i1.p1 TRINITY_DN1625_c0_g3~~TRINITY_DN1625_c0_g3_i1.p1  ORF type:complete len:149 (+),score=4.73 TRINITY_DN1625_c0_g3_i1:76-522(+)
MVIESGRGNIHLLYLLAVKVPQLMGVPLGQVACSHPQPRLNGRRFSLPMACCLADGPEPRLTCPIVSKTPGFFPVCVCPPQFSVTPLNDLGIHLLTGVCRVAKNTWDSFWRDFDGLISPSPCRCLDPLLLQALEGRCPLRDEALQNYA